MTPFVILQTEPIQLNAVSRVPLHSHHKHLPKHPLVNPIWQKWLMPRKRGIPMRVMDMMKYVARIIVNIVCSVRVGFAQNTEVLHVARRSHQLQPTIPPSIPPHHPLTFPL
jgi:hypothetical protein